jgi:hypothetical protein
MDSESGLGDLLAELPQRESAGRMAADRFDYQKNWALCRILELHAKADDYVLFFEYHEDVAILDSATNPTRSTFVQVKTAKGKKWSLKELTKRPPMAKSKAGASILGKLCEKEAKLGTHKADYLFVTNASIDLGQSQHDEPGELDVKSIPSEVLKDLKQALENELGCEVDSLVADRLRFEKSTLALDNHEDATKGRLATFVDGFAVGCSVPIAPLYRTLFGEIRRKTVATTTGSFAQVCGRKGISRSDLDGMLRRAIRSTPADRTWMMILARLEGSDAEIRRLNSAFPIFYVWSLQAGKPGIQTLRAKFQHEMASHREAGEGLLKSSAAAISLARPEELVAVGLDVSTAQVMVLMGAYEDQDGEVPDIDFESAEPQS